MVAKAELLDQLEELRKLDRSDMLAVVGRMFEMLKEAAKINVAFPSLASVTSVVVAGVGGSGMAGQLALDLLWKKAKVPLYLWGGYGLPEFLGAHTLLVALSYSGETEETLSLVKEAGNKNVKVVCITSGGKLKEVAEQKNYPLCLIPKGYQPRAALPFLLVALLRVLEKAEVVPSFADEIQEASLLLQKLQQEYRPQSPLRTNPAKQLAKKLLGKTPLIFGSWGTTAAVALRFKTQLNENSKVTALYNFFPELNHNEIVNLSYLKRENHNFFWVLFRDEGDAERIKKRIEITKSLLVRQLGGVHEIFSQGKSNLARMFSLIFFGDYVSVYLALLQGIDPTPVESIMRLKKELAR